MASWVVNKMAFNRVAGCFPFVQRNDTCHRVRFRGGGFSGEPLGGGWADGSLPAGFWLARNYTTGGGGIIYI